MSDVEPYRVLHVIASLHFGGSQAFVMNVYKNINREKIQFDFVVTPEERKDLYGEVEKMGGRIFVSPRYNGKNYFAYKKWWNDFYRQHPEYMVIHGHVRSTAAIYLKIAKKYGRITIAHSHSTSNGNGLSAIVKDIMQLPIRNVADYLFACSDQAGEWLYGAKALKRNNYKMIPNGIDIQRFTFDVVKRKQIRQKLAITDGDYVIGHVGRFTEPKNHGFLVDLFAEFLHKVPEAKLLLVGDGELRVTVEKRAELLGIGNKVILVGARINTEDYYQAMDVFVFPSLWEGLPVSVVEAQANGLHCMLSDTITKDVNLTNLVHSLSLNKMNDWVAEIRNLQNISRGTVSDENRNRLHSFDVKTVAEELQKFYIEQEMKERK